MADPTTIKVNGSGTRVSDRFRIQPSTQAMSTVLTSAAAVDRIQSGDRGKSIFDMIGGGIKWLTRGWGGFLGGGQTGARTPGPYTSSYVGDPDRGSVTDGSSKKSGGLGGLVSTVLGGLAGQGLSLGGIISGIGGYFTEKSKMEFNLKKLGVDEALGKENNAINRLIAESNIAENKRRTAISSTFMGHTSPIAAVEGVTGIEPGLQVADQWVSPEVRKQSAGALGGSNQGLITQGNQRRVA